MSIAQEDKLLDSLKEVLGKDAAIERMHLSYNPSEDIKKVRGKIVKDFTKSWNIMYKPRPEFDDLNLLDRMEVDLLSSNTYLRNNGEMSGENWWRSSATKPIVRSKIQQISAYAISRLLFPKVFSRDEDNEEQEDAATIMGNLMEYVGDKVNYKMMMLEMVYNSLSTPISYAYKGYQEIKRLDKKGKLVNDEYLSGHIARVIPADQLFFPNVNERNLQLQDFIIWRNVISYDVAEAKYATKYEEFKYVKPGIQAVLNDANQIFYSVYDNEIRKNEVEEVIYWNRNKCSYHVLVNGVLLTEVDNKNDREDGRYPFEPMTYSLIRSDFIYGKSLAHSEWPNAKTLNEMWRMLNDATFLSNFPPMITRGGETINNQVITPGGITAFKSVDSNLEALNLASNLNASVQAVKLLEESIEETTPTPQDDKMTGGNVTAYSIYKKEQQALLQLGNFYMMIADFVTRFGKLIVSDIIQYETTASMKETGGLAYKSWLFQDKKGSTGKQVSRKFILDNTLPSGQVGEDKQLELSQELLQQEEDGNDDIEIYKAHPKLFRMFNYELMVTADQMKQRSEELEEIRSMELYDKAINNPYVKQDEITRDFLFKAYSRNIDADHYVKSEEEMQQAQQQQQGGQPQTGGQPGQPGQPQPPQGGQQSFPQQQLAQMQSK